MTEHQARDGCRADGKLREPLSHDIEWPSRAIQGPRFSGKGRDEREATSDSASSLAQ